MSNRKRVGEDDDALGRVKQHLVTFIEVLGCGSRNVTQGVSMRLNIWTLGFLAIIDLGSLQALAQANREQKVDVGSYRVFTSQAGSKEPVVVFEAGLGEDTSTWDKVLPRVSQFSHTFAYDRAGLGKSDSSPNPKSVEQMVKELHSVLNAAHVSPPYIFVGHSLGGAVVQLFAHDFPGEVAGLVLVDPEDGRLLDRLKAQLPKEEWDAREKTLAQMMAGASPAQSAEIESSKSSGKALAAGLPIPDVPVVLLTGTLKDPSFPGNPAETGSKTRASRGSFEICLARRPRARSE